MRRILIAVAAVALLSALPAVAQARRVPLHVGCQFKRSEMTAARARLQSGATVAQLCRDRALVRARPRGVSYGSCGYSWIYDYKIGPGWINEEYGTVVFPGIWYGTAQIHWYNYSNGGSNYYTEGIYPDSWSEWNSYHHAYTRSGYIGSVFEAGVITRAGYGCYNYSIAPWAFVWA